MTLKETLEAADLDSLSDGDLLDHLDRVSEALKRRNNLVTPLQKSTVADLLEVLSKVSGSSPSG